MLQLKTIHDARHHRALPSSARLHARSTSLLAPRRVGRDAAASGPGGGGCSMAARSAGSAARAEALQGRARPQKVAPPSAGEVEVNVRKEDPPAVAAGAGADVGRSSTLSHDFELVARADTTFDRGADTPARRSPADEDEWEFLSFEHEETVLAKSPTNAYGPSSPTTAAAPSAPVVAA
ncbi:hypothetical protein JCM9279_001822 [Rhodotorula babjevae]